MKIYKFFPLDTEDRIQRLAKMVEDGSVWFSSYHDLNDPMEGIFYTNEQSRELLEKFKLNKQQYLIGCFGTSYNNTTLWRYYADSYKGCCVAFSLIDKIQHLFDKREIDYITWEDFSNPLNPENDLLSTIFFRKLVAWRNENEFRIIVEKSRPDNYVEVGKVTALYLGNALAEETIEKLTCYSALSNLPVYKTFPDYNKKPIKISLNGFL